MRGMPHLQFEVTEPVDRSEVASFADRIADLYAGIMDTGTGHVGVTVRDGASLALGRADADDRIAFLNADVRAGRTEGQRRELAVAVMEELADRWDVPTENVYVVYTEHPGADFHLREGPLSSWSSDEAGDGSAPN